MKRCSTVDVVELLDYHKIANQKLIVQVITTSREAFLCRYDGFILYSKQVTSYASSDHQIKALNVRKQN